MSNGRMLSASGIEFYVEDSGETGLPVMLCLHSLFLDGRMFDQLAAAASGTFRVIRPDFRGQGRSGSSGEASIGMDTCASDIEALMKQLHIESAHVVASSMGGDVGLRLAARRPEFIRSIVLLGSSARAEQGEQLERFRAWVDEAGRAGFTGPILDTTMSIMFGETTRKNSAKTKMLQVWCERISALPTSLRPAMSGVIERGSIVELLPSIEAPALVISGEECVARPPEWAAELADGLPNAELVMLPKIGHSPLLETPETVIPRILKFLRAVESRSQAAV